MPVLISAQQLTVITAAFDCEPLGSTVVLTVPGSAIGNDGAHYVVVAKSVEEAETRATGAAQTPVPGMPEVALAADGTPSVTIPDTKAPSDLKISVLKQGDGPEVAEGDGVVVQHYGVAWDTGESFDSSWSRNAPSEFSTTGVYEGFGKAIVGQRIGSQVLVVMPPSMGDTNGDLKGKTLVFVIDILGATRAAAQ